MIITIIVGSKLDPNPVIIIAKSIINDIANCCWLNKCIFYTKKLSRSWSPLFSEHEETESENSEITCSIKNEVNGNPLPTPDILGSSWFAGFFFTLSRMSPYFPLPSTFTKRCYVPILCKTFNVRDYVNNLTNKKCTNVYQISYFVY